MKVNICVFWSFCCFELCKSVLEKCLKQLLKIILKKIILLQSNHYLYIFTEKTKLFDCENVLKGTYWVFDKNSELCEFAVSVLKIATPRFHHFLLTTGFGSIVWIQIPWTITPQPLLSCCVEPCSNKHVRDYKNYKLKKVFKESWKCKAIQKPKKLQQIRGNKNKNHFIVKIFA